MRITLEIDNIDFKNRIEQFRDGKFDVDLNFRFNDMSSERIIIRDGVPNDESKLMNVIDYRLKSGIVEVDIIDSAAKQYYKEKIEGILKNRGVDKYNVSLESSDDFPDFVEPNAYFVSLYEGGAIVFMRFKGIFIDFELNNSIGSALSVIKSIKNV